MARGTLFLFLRQRKALTGSCGVGTRISIKRWHRSRSGVFDAMNNGKFYRDPRKSSAGGRNFQFEKPIPNSTEMMRIEVMAPEEFKRRGNIRVDVQQEVHARACTGGSIALTESSLHVLSGKLPDALQFTASIRVTKPHALVMLKLLALDDRYRNIRGPEEARHDREEARTHAADIVAIVSAQFDLEQFKADFERQFHLDAALALRVFRILGSYFRETTSPGILVYEESIVADKPLDRDARREISAEIARAQSVMKALLPEGPTGLGAR